MFHEVLEHRVAERAGASRDHEGLVLENAIAHFKLQLNKLKVNETYRNCKSMLNLLIRFLS